MISSLTTPQPYRWYKDNKIYHEQYSPNVTKLILEDSGIPSISISIDDPSCIYTIPGTSNISFTNKTTIQLTYTYYMTNPDDYTSATVTLPIIDNKITFVKEMDKNHFISFAISKAPSNLIQLELFSFYGYRFVLDKICFPKIQPYNITRSTTTILAPNEALVTPNQIGSDYYEDFTIYNNVAYYYKNKKIGMYTRHKSLYRIRYLAAFKDVWVCFGDSGNYSDILLIYSADHGRTWNTSLSFTSSKNYQLHEAEGLLLLTSYSYSQTANDQCLEYSSTDGIHWQQIPHTNESGLSDITLIEYNKLFNLYILYGSLNYTNVTLVSEDGCNWNHPQSITITYNYTDTQDPENSYTYSAQADITAIGKYGVNPVYYSSNTHEYITDFNVDTMPVESYYSTDKLHWYHNETWDGNNYTSHPNQFLPLTRANFTTTRIGSQYDSSSKYYTYTYTIVFQLNETAYTRKIKIREQYSWSTNNFVRVNNLLYIDKHRISLEDLALTTTNDITDVTNLPIYDPSAIYFTKSIDRTTLQYSFDNTNWIATTPFNDTDYIQGPDTYPFLPCTERTNPLSLIYIEGVWVAIRGSIYTDTDRKCVVCIDTSYSTDLNTWTESRTLKKLSISVRDSANNILLASPYYSFDIGISKNSLTIKNTVTYRTSVSTSSTSTNTSTIKIPISLFNYMEVN